MFVQTPAMSSMQPQASALAPTAYSAEQLMATLLLLPSPAALVGVSGEFIAANSALCQYLGVADMAALAGRALADFVEAQRHGGLLLHFQQLHKTTEVYEWDCSLRIDSVDLKARIQARAFPDLGLATLVFFDITSFRHDEQVLRKTLLEQQAILENAAVGILFTRDNLIVECNIRAAEMFGFSHRQILGQQSRSIFPSEQAFLELSTQASPLLSVGHSFQTELQLMRHDGEIFWCRLYGRAIDPWHTEQGTIWITEDINAHRQDEEKLHQIVLEMQAIMAYAPLAIGFHRDQRILRYNERYAEIFRFDGKSGVGEQSLTLYPSSEAFDKAAALAVPLLLAGKPFQAEMEMRRQDNTVFWAHAIAYVINPEQPLQGTVWIFDDRSQQKMAEEASKQLLLEQNAILDNAWVGIMFTRAHQILRSNPRLNEMFGHAPGGLDGMKAQILFPSQVEYGGLVLEAAPLLANGLPFEKTELKFKRRDGSLFWGRVRSKAVDSEHNEEGTIWIIEDISEARQDALEMQRMLMELDAIMSNASVGIVFTKNRQIFRFNRRFSEMFGYTDADLGMPGRDMYPSQEAYERVGAQAAPLLSVGQPYHTELDMLKKDGGTMWVQLIGYVLDVKDPALGTIWILEDRTEARRAEQSLRNALLENQAILESAVIGIAVVENGYTLSCNRKMEELFHYEAGGIKGTSVQLYYQDKQDWARVRQEVAADFAAGRVHSCEQILVTKDGLPFWARLTGRPFDLAQPHGRSVWLVDDITERREAAQAVLRARDELELRVQERTAELAGANTKLQAEIAERRQIEERIHHMAYHDSLTGLPNRALLADRLNRAMLAVDRNQRRLAVMFIDLDRFKAINDTLGHLTGDRLLKEVAGRLCLAVRASDTVSRLGGDEFVVVVPDLLHSNEAAIVAQKMIDMLATPILVEGRELHISPSIGICLYPDDGADVETLMRHADTAMYYAKDNGRNNYQFFTQAMHLEASLQFDLENRLRGALMREEFVLHYQPIMDMQRRSLHGMEVLLRWQKSAEELVSPDRFIPILEENGLIVAVGEWVLRRACQQLVEWQQQGLKVVPLAVNLSPRQFMQRGLTESIARILHETKVNPALLEFEITETALMQHGEHTLEVLHQINKMGIRLSIDDFGTGYSSLAYLKRFPVNKLKIDRAFVKDLEHSSDDRAIVSAILALSNSLQLSVVAEGVEEEQQFAFLRASGCQYAQGYLFSRPVEASQAREYLL